MNITESQVHNLLQNAYGFMDKYNSLMMHDTSNEDETEFCLQNIECESITLSFEGASICPESFEVIFKLNDCDKLERFTVLIVPNGKTLLELLN